ncbi:unnamed protein product [Paramecium primaurelia]|uniref:Transmembrane protein n=1 Tax=Paramecium primaurelia TaxID=5886 RepID=A0A8S1QDL9_PARPR|nr:unnamed protein product [Paramecium primaurelia]
MFCSTYQHQQLRQYMPAINFLIQNFLIQKCNSLVFTKCTLETYLTYGLCKNYCPNYYQNNLNNEFFQLSPKNLFLQCSLLFTISIQYLLIKNDFF